MTYKQIAQWSEQNVPMSQAENYQDWKNLCEQEFLNSGHFLPEGVYPLLERKWLKYHDTLDIGQEAGIDLPEKTISPPKPSGTVRKRLATRIENFPSDLEFSPKQIAQFTGINKNTVRRELSEMIQQGTLQRISRGRYRLAP